MEAPVSRHASSLRRSSLQLVCESISLFFRWSDIHCFSSCVQVGDGGTSQPTRQLIALVVSSVSLWVHFIVLQMVWHSLFQFVFSSGRWRHQSADTPAQCAGRRFIQSVGRSDLSPLSDRFRSIGRLFGQEVCHLAVVIEIVILCSSYACDRNCDLTLFCKCADISVVNKKRFSW